MKKVLKSNSPTKSEDVGETGNLTAEDGEVEAKAVPKGGQVVHDEGILAQQRLESAANIETAKGSDQVRLGGGDIESIDEEPLTDNEGEERVDVGDVAAMDGSAKSENLLESCEIMNTDDGTFIEESLKEMIVIEDLDGKEELLLGGGGVEPLNQKLFARKQVENFIDDLYTSGLAAADTGVNALIAGGRDLETILAGENLASSGIAGNAIDMGEILAVLAIGTITAERRGNSATTTCSPVFSTAMCTAKNNVLTTLWIGLDVNTVITVSAVGDTTDGFSGVTGGGIALPLGRVL